MLSAIYTPTVTATIVSSMGYVFLFLCTIRQNRGNRPVVLGVITVALFGFFLFYVDLSEKHASFLVIASILSLIVLMGFYVLTLVALDTMKWTSEKRQKPEVDENEFVKANLGTK
jgi:high-affinity Fe2+/Pb2+ permease